MISSKLFFPRCIEYTYDFSASKKIRYRDNPFYDSPPTSQNAPIDFADEINNSNVTTTTEEYIMEYLIYPNEFDEESDFNSLY